MSGFGQQIEFEHFGVFVKNLAEVPDHALIQHRLAAAVSVGDLQAAFGETNRPAAHADALVVVENQDRNALLPEVQSGRHADRPATDHNHRMANRLRFVLIGRLLVWIEFERERIAILQQVRTSADHPCNCAHMSRSRAAVQIRGVSIPRASS